MKISGEESTAARDGKRTDMTSCRARAFLAGVAIATVVAAASTAPRGHAEFKGYFDISGIEIPALGPPMWERRHNDRGQTYLCVETAKCPTPTAVEIKAVLRTEDLPAAFRTGPLSPEALTQQGEINARRLGSRFLGTVAVKVAGIEGVQMTAAYGDGDKAVHYLTTWLGRGDRMLDVKITSPDLALARRTAEQMLEPLVAAAFR